MEVILNLIVYLILTVSVLGSFVITYISLKILYTLVTNIEDTLQGRVTILDYIKDVGKTKLRIMYVISYIFILLFIIWLIPVLQGKILEGTEDFWLVGVLGILIYLISEYSLNRLKREDKTNKK